MSYGLKTALALLSAALLLGIVVAVFWYQDLRYALPTPRPENLEPVPAGAVVPLDRVLPALHSSPAGESRLLLLHFFNPGCPCSRFNTDHIRGMYQRYRDRVRFVAVVETEADADAAERERTVETASGRFGGMEAVADPGGRAAAACEVYSTPQAVILRPSGELLFRGNYNVSRFCTDRATAFARIALDALLAGQKLPDFPPTATTAYGCELPTAPSESND